MGEATPVKCYEFRDLIAEFANKFGIPGVAAGLWHKGKTVYAHHGVTSTENPLPIDNHTLFQSGSIGKTFTATALLMLESEGRVDLQSPVRRYIPELRLADESAAKQVTLQQLLNHTAGWEGDFFPDTGEGDDALARFVCRFNELTQLTSPGKVFSYNNAAFSLAGRVIEKVTGETYERAIRSMLLQPLGFRESFFSRDEIMTRRFAVGHTPAEDDRLQIARPWGLPRNSAPAGGISTSIADLLAWGRFHAGDSFRGDGLRELSFSKLSAMRTPTVHTPGGAFGDAMGIGWFLSNLGDTWLVSHSGSTPGQEASLSLLPDYDWALALLTNASPVGLAMNRELRQQVLASCTGIIEEPPKPKSVDSARLTAYAGEYRARGMCCRVDVDEAGELVLSVNNDPQLVEQATETDEASLSHPMTLQAGLVDEDTHRYVFKSGLFQGITGYFDCNSDGETNGVHLFGRWLPRATM
nr:serine hydrolase domain-containing protein [Halorhodospira halochloris]